MVFQGAEQVLHTRLENRGPLRWENTLAGFRQALDMFQYFQSVQQGDYEPVRAPSIPT